MGIHSGEASRDGPGLVGLSVHRAARVAAVAHGGQVLLSETAAALVRDSLPAGGALMNLGPHRLKDLGTPGAHLPAPGGRPPSEFPPCARSATRRCQQSAGPAVEVHRPRAGAGSESGPWSSPRLVTLTGAGGSGRPDWPCRWRPSCSTAPATASGWSSWPRSQPGTPCPRPSPKHSGSRTGRARRSWRLCSMPSASPVHADRPGQLRAPDRRLRQGRRRDPSQCPQVRLVATSREPLGIAGETIYRVPSLSLPGPRRPSPSVLRRGRAAGRAGREQGVDLALDEETIPLMVSVCRRLDGLPLAIELAAARLRSLSLVSLRDRSTSASACSPAAAAPPWRDSRRCGRPSTGLIRCSPGREVAAAPPVGVRRGLRPRRGRGRVRRPRIDVFDATDILGSLVDKSLVVAEPAGDALRYRLLETIRQFAAERLAEAGNEAAVAAAAAHCEYFLALAEKAAPQLAGPDRPAGSRGSTPTTRTCGRPPSMPPATQTGRLRSCASESPSADTGSRAPVAGKHSDCSCPCWTAPTPAPNPGCSGRRW